MTCTSLRSGIASSGVLYNPQMPAAMAEIVRMPIRNLFRALASMTFSRNVGGGGIVGVGSITSPRFQRPLYFGFGINQEVRAAHDPFTVLQPSLDRVVGSVFAG